MAKESKISWCDSTFNPVRGCTKVSPGCANCYADRDSVRFPHIRGVWGDKGTRILAVPDAWKTPLNWDRLASEKTCDECDGLGQRALTGNYKKFTTCTDCKGTGKSKEPRPRVFCASLGDVFEDWKGILHFPSPISVGNITPAYWDGTQLIRELEETAQSKGYEHASMDHMRIELFRLIEKTPHLDWLLLTKRPQNIMRMVPAHWQERFPDNVWIGTTVEDQQRADERIPILLQIPAKVRFLSCEPLLGPVEISSYLFTKPKNQYCTACKDPANTPCDGYPCQWKPIHWVICGGESGSKEKARPMNPEWARSLRDQCAAADVPFFFKQWGSYAPSDDLDGGMEFIGRNHSDVLDNKTHQNYPA